MGLVARKQGILQSAYIGGQIIYLIELIYGVNTKIEVQKEAQN